MEIASFLNHMITRIPHLRDCGGTVSCSRQPNSIAQGKGFPIAVAGKAPPATAFW